MVPWSREAWNMVQSVSTTSSHRVFSSLPGIASGPVALYGLMSFSSFNTPFLLTTIGLASGWSVGVSLGMEVVSSEVKTDVNWSFKMFDFFTLSL